MSSTLSLSPRDRQARRYATGLALIATLGPFFYGFEGMVLNAAIKAVGSTFELGPILQGVAGAAGVIGGLIGALSAGRISDRIGRKTTLMWVGPFLLIEALLGPLSPLLGPLGYPFLILTRIIGGIGFGAATTVAPGYVAEIAPAEIRGRLIGFRQLAIILGLFLAGLINTGVVALTGGAAKPAFGGLMTWQVLFACLIIPALLFVIFTARIPESPRYLVSAGRSQEAEAVLAKLCGEEDPAVRVEAIAQSLAITGGAKLSIGQILSSQWRGLVFIGMAIAAFQQLTGINGVFFYSNSLFAAVGFTESMALAQTLLITAFKIVGVLSGIMLVDRVGRSSTAEPSFSSRSASWPRSLRSHPRSTESPMSLTPPSWHSLRSPRCVRSSWASPPPGAPSSPSSWVRCSPPRSAAARCRWPRALTSSSTSSSSCCSPSSSHGRRLEPTGSTAPSVSSRSPSRRSS